MTELLTGYNVDKLPNSAVIRNRLYLMNDYDEAKMWDGLSSTVNKMGIDAPDAAIGAPTQGAGSDCTNGDHLVRYRYVDSNSPAGIYRSNPSASLTITITSTQDQTFSVGDAGSGDDIIRSADPKVDTIQIEMTEADGTTYYVAKEIANSGVSSAVVAISDTSLIEQDASATYDDFGHEPPPLAISLAECRGYTFVGGSNPIAMTGLGVTNASTNVTGTGIPENIVGRQIKFNNDTVVYTVAAWVSASQITLATAYAGSTDASSTGTFVSKTPSRIYWSRVNMPESFKVLTRARDMLQGKNDVLVGMADYIGDLWVFGRHSMERLVFVSDPASGERIDVAGSYGLWNQRCLIQIEGRLFGWGPNGIWVINGARPLWISERIDTTISGNINYSKSDLFHSAYDPQTKIIRWWFVEDSGTQCQRAVCYDLEREQFYIDTYRNEINSACIGLDTNNNIHQFVCDDSYIWKHEGDTDGVANTDRRFTAASGTTTTVVVDETISGVSADWAGVTIYNATQGISTVLTGFSGSTFTCASWTAAVNGDVLYVGSIPFKIQTPWFTSSDDDKIRPSYLHIFFSPAASGTVRVRYYTDFSVSAEVMDIGADDHFPDGIEITNGTNYIDVDIDGGSGDGFVPVPMIADYKRAIKSEVECFDSRGTLRILDIKYAQTAERYQKDGE